MSPPGDYFLNWSQHQANRTLAFNALRENQQFADVTLARDDDEQLEAHKVILSANSYIVILSAFLAHSSRTFLSTTTTLILFST